MGKYIRTENGIYEVIKPYDPSKLLSSRTTMVKDKSMLGFTNIPNMVILKEADNIEELIQDDDLALFFELKVYCDDYYYEYTIKNALMSVRDAKKITGGDDPYGYFKIKDIKELYIKNKYGDYIKIAERKDNKGELELL